MSKIVVVKHATAGIKRIVELHGSSSLGDVFATASKQFNLNQNTHELRLGPDKLNLSESIEGSKIPETVVLDIVPKTTGERVANREILVEVGFSDEGYLYEKYSKAMDEGHTMWDVVKELVPSHMAYSDEDVCLNYLRNEYRGKKRLKSVNLSDLCGRERSLFFTCSRNYLQTAYNRSELDNDSYQDKPRRPTPPSADPLQVEMAMIPTLGNLSPGLVELNERRGRLYHRRYICAHTRSGAISQESCMHSMKRSPEEGKIIVRVVFPNVAVMEGTFSPDETIQDVANFLKKYLTENAKKFSFYTIQPRLIMKPNDTIGNMRSSPPGTLWYSGKLGSSLFKKAIHSSLEGRVFSFVSSDVPEESKINLCPTSSGYSWNLQT